MTPEQAVGHMKRASSFRTICEVHREMFDLCDELSEPQKSAFQNLVIEAFIMGKKMDAKLREYKADWDAGFYELNRDHRQDSARRKAA